MPLPKTQRGFTMLELVIAMGAMTVIALLVVQAIIALSSQQTVRKNVAELQSNARQALDVLGADLRHASLGSGTGVVWQAVGASRVSRPAVQVFTAVPGSTSGAIADAKPGTDAVLVVEAIPGPGAARTVTTGPLSTSVGAFDVAAAGVFGPGDTVLFGDYTDAAWGTLETVTSSGTVQQLRLLEGVNVLPGRPVPQLGRGAPVRRARARLYYVNTRDELVRMPLAVPRAPTEADLGPPDVLATGVENMQVDCAMSDGGTAVVACSDVSNPAPALPSTDPIALEAATTFGTFGAGGGPRISIANVGRLRQVVVSIVARSPTPLLDVNGDPPIAVVGASGVESKLVPGTASGAAASAAFARRSYRSAAAIRNTSLESL